MIEHNAKQITLTNLADGAADELFIDALSQVTANIADPNTDPKEKRSITLTFNVSADEERRVGNIEVKCSAKLAGVRPVKVGVYFGNENGLPIAVEAPRQQDMFPTPDHLLKMATKKEASQ